MSMIDRFLPLLRLRETDGEAVEYEVSYFDRRIKMHLLAEKR